MLTNRGVVVILLITLLIQFLDSGSVVVGWVASWGASFQNWARCDRRDLDALSPAADLIQLVVQGKALEHPVSVGQFVF
jgi:hypothetical protein